ncbi:hypothetical protein NM688_g4825 [Phlebia brevispora]|uniref:Uncharacterized protein n=1 Tax=Phlebia brevispora TaxID=194682 RepID=A0ACC1T214_9APHY|nr:hypothetical protein NM688_g4825 [Phlebia brevispora]
MSRLRLQRMALPVATALLLSLATPGAAHKHHSILDEDEANKPVDSILWIHIFLQIIVWGFLFPIGMVLGMARSKWHVPLQSCGFVFTLGGYILGHSHGGRSFLAGAHGVMANILFAPIFLQLGLGIYLKLHIHEETIRPWAVRAHGVLGKAYPILGWLQMLFGVIAFRGYCRGGALGQCLAHYIMGSGFIAYGIIMAIMLLVGENWIRRSKRSPEWWDSWVIMLWGIVNTFTEHHGGDWSVKDMQHTVMGVIWWAGGILGIILARNNQVSILAITYAAFSTHVTMSLKRTVVPALIVIITGWAFSNHAQALMISTNVHAMVGYTLMMAGVTRIIEVCFIAPKYTPLPETAVADDNRSEHTLTDNTSNASAWQTSKAFRHLPPFLLTASGVLFMSATDEELRFVDGEGMDHVTYILLMFSIAFLIYSLVVSLIRIWARLSENASSSTGDGSIELSTASKWYAPVPGTDAEAEAARHVIGEDD